MIIGGITLPEQYAAAGLYQAESDKDDRRG